MIPPVRYDGRALLAVVVVVIAAGFAVVLAGLLGIVSPRWVWPGGRRSWCSSAWCLHPAFTRSTIRRP
ncbi:MAG: hypothetical protein R2705_22430 [Ilumatobacteraceae bacterium]